MKNWPPRHVLHVVSNKHVPIENKPEYDHDLLRYKIFFSVPGLAQNNFDFCSMKLKTVEIEGLYDTRRALTFWNSVCQATSG